MPKIIIPQGGNTSIFTEIMQIKAGKYTMKSVLCRMKENHFQGEVCKIYTKIWAECHRFSNYSGTKLGQQLLNIYVWLTSAKLIKTYADYNTYSCYVTCSV